MYVKEFKAQINRGLGSALLFIKENPSKAKRYFNAILYACTHNTAYDPQCEDSRAQYLYEIVQLTPFKDELEDKILESFIKAEKYWDIKQLFGLAKLIANGKSSVREVMYEKFKNYNSNENQFIGAEEIIALDKEKGLIFVATAIGDQLLSDEEYWETDWILQVAKDEIGELKTIKLLEESSKTSTQIKKYLDSVKSFIEEREQYKFEPVSYNEVKIKIDQYNLQNAPYSFRSLGRRLSPDDLLRAARDLEKETDKAKTIALLYLFFGMKYPLDPKKIISLAKSDDEDISNAALRVLRNIKHDALHDLAVQNLKKPNFDPDGIDLFIRNYEEHDYLLLEKVVCRDYDSYDFDFHGVGLAIIEVFEKNKTGNCLHSMIEIYRRGWCSSCRESCVDILISNKILPKWMIDECKYDCNLDIRNKVREYKD